jgi:hypothetical protein
MRSGYERTVLLNRLSRPATSGVRLPLAVGVAGGDQKALRSQRSFERCATLSQDPQAVP